MRQSTKLKVQRIRHILQSSTLVQSANRHQPASLQEYSIPRERMVARLREHYSIKDPQVLEEMRNGPRPLLVPQAFPRRAYGDHALPISASQTISQPFIVA